MRTRLAQMYLLVLLCLLCSWVAPYSCRSVDTRDPPSEDLEPFVAHHHHEGNIAELLIPLLERSLAQSEARTNEKQHRRNKAAKKVIQVLPYRGSEEHKRKGWRKLNSHKKQVVEITPLHGKNRAKPLAYILSAAKPSHAEHAEVNDDVSTSTSELEHDKSTSEEQQSSEENRGNNDDMTVNTLRTANVDSPSASEQSNEDAYSKDLSVSDEESADVTEESNVTAEKSEDRKVVVVEDSEEVELHRKSGKHLHHNHHHKSKASFEAVTAEEEGVTAEDVEVTLEDNGVTAEDLTVTAEDREATAEVTLEDTADVTAEAVTAEAADVTAEAVSAEAADITAEAVTAEDLDATVENVDVTAEERAFNAENVELTEEDRVVTVEDVEVTVEDKAVTAEEETGLEDNVTSEDQAVTLENDAVTAEGQLTMEDVTAERSATADAKADVTEENTDVTVEENVTHEKAVTSEDTGESPKHGHVHTHRVATDINNLFDSFGRQTATETEDSDEPSRSSVENDIVISSGQQNSDSADKSINKLFNARARDIIELIQSSVEASTAAHKDCLKPSEKHDHKSYRLSFLFNK